VTEAEEIFAELVADYGLERLADKALARALAEALVAESPNPSTIVALRAALPPKPGTASADRPLAKLDDEELALATSLALALEGRSDPDRTLHRLSALRQRVRVLEGANEYLRGQLSAARRPPRDAPASRLGADSASAGSPDAPAYSNGLPGRHGVHLVKPSEPPKLIDEREAKLRAQRQASEDHAARLLEGVDDAGGYREHLVSYERDWR